MSSLVKYVDHTYRDYSRYIEDGGELIRHKKSNNNFTARLHRVLSDPQNSAVITWMVSDTYVFILLNTNGIVHGGIDAIGSNDFICLVSNIYTLLPLLIYLHHNSHMDVPLKFYRRKNSYLMFSPTITCARSMSLFLDS